MLTDHRKKLIKEASDAARRYAGFQEYGEFIEDLASWDWFATISLSRRQSRFRAAPELNRFLGRVRTAARRPIGWFVAEARANQSGRLHFHVLIAGVAHLDRKEWLREANRVFGNSKIETFDSSLGGSFYLAQNAFASEAAEFYLGGDLLESVPRLKSWDDRSKGIQNI
jgi:hypothetical protein